MSIHAQMATREDTATMDKVINSLLGKISLVILTTVVFSGIIPLIFLVNQTILPWALKWATVMMVALIAGISSRCLLKDAKTLLVFLVSIVAYFISLYFLSDLTQEYIGIKYSSDLNSSIDWVAFSQLLSGGLLILLVLRAWRITIHRKNTRRNSPSKQSRIPKPKRSKVKRNTYSKPIKTSRKNIVKSPRIVKKTKGIPTASSHYLSSQLAWISRKMNSLWSSSHSAWTEIEAKFHTQLSKGVLEITKPPVRIPSNRKSHPHKDIHLSNQVEHRCPYCLETVNPNDSRGVIECPICHTLHHADCWAVTGACQVPHHFD